MSIYSKSLRVLTIFRCLIFKVLFRSFFPFLSAFSPLSVSLFSCRPERNSCYYIALHPFCQHFFWIFFDFFSFLFFALYIVVYQCYKHKIFPPLTAFRRLPSKKSFLSSKKFLNVFKKYFFFSKNICWYSLFLNQKLFLHFSFLYSICRFYPFVFVLNTVHNNMCF